MGSAVMWGDKIMNMSLVGGNVACIAAMSEVSAESLWSCIYMYTHVGTLHHKLNVFSYVPPP